MFKKKCWLALHLLNLDIEIGKFNINGRNQSNNSLAALVVDAGHMDLLVCLIAKGLDVNIPSKSSSGVALFPIHQAINHPRKSEELVRALAEKANLSCRYGTRQRTPLMLAADRLCIPALEELLKWNESDRLAINAQCAAGRTALDRLSTLVIKGKTTRDRELAFDGVAMLLCHGAKLSNNKKAIEHFTQQRMALWGKIEEYLKNNRHLITQFQQLLEQRGQIAREEGAQEVNISRIFYHLDGLYSCFNLSQYKFAVKIATFFEENGFSTPYTKAVLNLKCTIPKTMDSLLS